jgi:hypothetical protein
MNLYILQLQKTFAGRCKIVERENRQMATKKAAKKAPAKKAAKKAARRSSGTSNQKATHQGNASSVPLMCFWGLICFRRKDYTGTRKQPREESMTRRRWIAEHWDEATATLVGAQAEHMTRVLRAQPGMEADVVAGGHVFHAQVAAVTPATRSASI